MGKIHHIGLETPDVRASMRFYQELGFVITDEVKFRSQDLYFLQLGNLTIELIESENASSHPVHICLEVDHIDLASKYHIMEGPYQLNNGWKTIFVKGPTGEVVEFLEKDSK